MSSPRASILSLLLITVLICSIPACPLTASTYILYHRTNLLTLSRRAAPPPLLSACLSHFLDHFLSFLQSHAPDTPLSSLCINPSLKHYFEAQYNVNNIHSQFLTFLAMEPHMFFLPPDQFPDEQIPPLQPRLQAIVNSMQKDAEDAMLYNSPTNVSFTAISRLPMSPHFFFDPHQPSVCARYADILSVATQTHTNALQLLHEVVALVFRLHILDVPIHDSLQLLRHNAAFIFTGIRCTRDEGPALTLPRVFMPWYNQASQILTNTISEEKRAKVPLVPVEVVRNVMGDRLDSFASYASWGRLHTFEFEGEMIRRLDIRDIIFDPTLVSQVKNHIGMLAPRPIVIRDAIEGITARISCATGLHAFSSPPVVPITICCPDLCRQSHLLAVGVALTTESCCLEYYRNPNSLVRGPLSVVATIRLDPYGYSPRASTNLRL